MSRSWSGAKFLKTAGAGFLTAILCSCTGASISKHKIAQILLQYHRDGRFSGSALVGYGDTVVYEGAFGFADETWKIRNTPTTRFQIGSLTKQFTAALILDLAQKDRINLDATLSTYLPDYRPDAADAITIRQLLGHSAGVPDFVHRPDIMQISGYSCGGFSIWTVAICGSLEKADLEHKRISLWSSRDRLL